MQVTDCNFPASLDYLLIPSDPRLSSQWETVQDWIPIGRKESWTLWSKFWALFILLCSNPAVDAQSSMIAEIIERSKRSMIVSIWWDVVICTVYGHFCFVMFAGGSHFSVFHVAPRCRCTALSSSFTARAWFDVLQFVFLHTGKTATGMAICKA